MAREREATEEGKCQNGHTLVAAWIFPVDRTQTGPLIIDPVREREEATPKNK